MKNLHYAGLAALALTVLHAQAARADDYCREYTRKVVIGHTVQNAYGTACRQPDGSWQIVSQDQGDQAVQPVPPPPDSRVTYVIEDPQPVYVQPRYVTYAPVYDDYAYGYPFWAGGVEYRHGYYNHGRYDGYHGSGGHGGGHGGPGSHGGWHH